MKNLRLFKVSGLRGSARADLEPPEWMEFYQNAAFYLFRSVGFNKNRICDREDTETKNSKQKLVFFKFSRFSLKTLVSSLLSHGSRGNLVSNRVRQKTLHVVVVTWVLGISGVGEVLAGFQRVS